MATHTVDCVLAIIPNLTATIAPFTLEVEDKTPTVEWNAGVATTFPSSNYFSWKSGGPSGGTIPTRSSDGKKLTLSYSQTAESTWTYAITLEIAGTVQVTIDPEIHNDPPVP